MKMIGSNKFRDLLSYIPGLLTLSLGIYLAIKQPQVNYVINQARTYVELVDGKLGYNTWKNIDLFFRIWIYHVTNPDEVMQGEFPIFEERGPYVYDLNLEKHVISVDEEADEMAFTVLRTYRFNKKQSGRNSGDDKIVMLNSAYYGTISIIIDKFPMFLPKFGNNILNLFPNSYDIFLRVKVKDILFDGLPLVCDQETNKDLALICNGLRGKKPPIIKNTDKLDHYLYSFFDNINMTDYGPFTVNRGVKNKHDLGNTTSYKGKRVSKYWSDEGCNLVSGTDSMIWPPLDEKLPFVSAYEPNLCRSVRLNYKREEIIHGLIGYQYELDETVWSEQNIKCYCPVNSKKVQYCLPKGLMNIQKCQEAPIIFSEPHFLHADQNLLEYAQGLEPNSDIHKTFITIEPLTGLPLSGSKKIQLNVELKPSPSVTLLSNLSQGYFPLLWAEEANTASVKQLSPIIMLYRLIHVLRYFPWLMISLGTFFTVKIWWIRGGNNNQTIVEATTIQSQRVTIHPVQRLIHHRPDNRRKRAFI